MPPRAIPHLEVASFMIVRRSRFIHLLPLADNRVLVLHAVTHVRVPVDRELADLIAYFDQPRERDAAIGDLAARLGYDGPTLRSSIADLMERGILTERAPEAELADTALSLGEVHGRDPGDLLDRHRRERKRGSHPYWSVAAATGLSDLGGARPRVDVLLFGDCDLQMESDFLRREAARRGIDLRVAAAFPDDIRFAADRPHQAIVIGALRARATIAVGTAAEHGGDPSRLYLTEAAKLIDGLRGHSAAPILIDTLPEPTVQPLGFADRGLHGHRNRFRYANLALAQLADAVADIHVVDIAAALAAGGAERLLDDGLVSFTHFGSPGWMLQRPEREKAAVHGIFPDTAPLADQLGGDPYLREAVVARAHMDALQVVLGIGRKKCVIVDLDSTLWPGVLAETGAPFAWTPEISGPFSYVGLYFGIHEALRALKDRGIVLACVSKNDEATVRELWKYPGHYPTKRLISPEDFVTWRVNWADKSENILSIAEELGFALDAFVFVDDNPLERERVRQRIPEITLMGEDLFTLRRGLLSDPGLQLPKLTPEATARTELVKAQLGRERVRREMVSESEFVASLDINCEIERVPAGADVTRLQELFQRTTQFNTTGRKFSVAELAALLGTADAAVFTLKVRDRFGDHGLVGGAVILAGEIAGFVMSCRVIGLGVEHRFIGEILDAFAEKRDELVARIIETSRNAPVRHLYRDNGFSRREDGTWHIDLAARRAAGAAMAEVAE